MLMSQPQNTPQVFWTADDACSFVRRDLPGGYLMEMTHAFHDTIVILAFSGSSWMSRQSGRTYLEGPGCVVVRDAGQVFDTKTLYCDEINGSQCREIHISPQEISTVINQDDEIPSLYLDFSNPVIDNIKLHEKLIHTHDVFEQGDCALMRSTCLAILLREMAQVTNRKKIDISPKPCRRRFSNVIDYMRDHYDEEITLQQLSDISNTNQFVLLRQFRNECGITPHQYLRTYRVNRAMDFIQQGIKLADVAQLCGFSDQSHMNRQFKRTVGVSPGRFYPTVTQAGHRLTA